MTSCNDYRDQVLFLRAGALDDDAARMKLLTRLEQGCPQCSQHLAEADETLGELLIGAGRAEPAPAVKARLMDRLRTSHDEPVGRIDPSQSQRRAASPVQPNRRVSSRFWRIVPLAASAAIAAATTFAIMSGEIHEREQHVAELTQLAESLQEDVDRNSGQPGGSDNAKDSLDRFFKDLHNLYRSTTLQVTSLTGIESIAGESVRMLWDEEIGQCIFIASSGLRVLSNPKWNLVLFDENNTAVEAGTVTFDERGFCSLRLELPEGSEPTQFAHAGLRNVRPDDDGRTSDPLELRGPLVH